MRCLGIVYIDRAMPRCCVGECNLYALPWFIVIIATAFHVPPACTFISNMAFHILTLPKRPDFCFSVFLELMTLKAYKLPAPLNTAC